MGLNMPGWKKGNACERRMWGAGVAGSGDASLSRMEQRGKEGWMDTFLIVLQSTKVQPGGQRVLE